MVNSKVGFDADKIGQSSLMEPVPPHQSNSFTHRSNKTAARYILLSEFGGGPDRPSHKLVRTGPLRYVFDKYDLINLIICA